MALGAEAATIFATLVIQNIKNGLAGEYNLIGEGSTLDNVFSLAANPLYEIATTEVAGRYQLQKKADEVILGGPIVPR